ncbi:MAG: hypothetical protein B6244_10530 [Candidatus Cloacimonetes bacterium 4572_55]|nr:MAG: hypothetical protein B6244_10530 [Candidatus Cloacimonetes bacterium 4572_55]
MKFIWIFFLLFGLLFELALPAFASENVPDLLEKKIKSLRQRLEKSQILNEERVRLLIRLGYFDAAEEALLSLESGPAIDLMMAKMCFERYQFEEFQRLSEKFPESEEAYGLRSQFLLLSQDLEGYQREAQKNQKKWVTARLNLAHFHYLTFDYDQAERIYQDALQEDLSRDAISRAYAGLANIAYKKNQFDQSLEYLLQAVDKGEISDFLANRFVLILIRLSRVHEAIQTAKITLKLNPFHQSAHYTLGNGYTNLNYTQLEERYADNFSNQDMLQDIIDQLARGEKIKPELTAFSRRNPQNVEALNTLGAIEWTEGDYDSAIVYYQEALRICPEYGRAHNGLARTLEKMEMSVSIYAERDEADFADKPMPDIENIDQFVINWPALSDRHKKRTALSLAPFKHFVPILVRSEATVYIKPLYERLSESPYFENMRDTRISYDSRLWDDVRGAGGFHMVTGIEDVERSIFHHYDTVLHEFAHQVHNIFPTEDWISVETLYRQAKKQEALGTKRFVSRYQSSSVWEYFAEGVNSYFSPRRNSYDTREIVRERLLELDPKMVEIVEKYQKETDLSRFLGKSIATTIYDKIGSNNLDAAQNMIVEIEPDAAKTEPVLRARSYLLSILKETEQAEAIAKRLTLEYPQYANSYRRLSHEILLKTSDYQQALTILRQGERAVIEGDQYNLDLSIADALVGLGHYKEAVDRYRRVLAIQQDHESALHGIATALNRLGDQVEADRYYKKALSRRSGIIELRAEYGRFLLDCDRREEARQQLDEAEILDARHPHFYLLKAQFETDPDSGVALCVRALKKVPYLQDALLLQAERLIEAGDRDSAQAVIHESIRRSKLLPEWHYESKKESFVTGNLWDQAQKARLSRLQNALQK